MRFFLAFISLLTISGLTNGQSDTFTDPRDKRVYATTQVNKLVWFTENLMYESKLSHCPNFQQSQKDCSEANYYHYSELDKVCPNGWRLPELKDWNAFVDLLEKEVRVTRMMEGNKKKFNVQLGKVDYNLFESENPLKITPVGRTQGNTLVKGSFADFWTTNEALDDPRFHMHITPDLIQGHTHKHNIDSSKEEENRKFAVRCVRDLN